MDNKVIFIGGSGRSGTNILRKILSNHSKVASLPFEYRFIIDPDGIIDFFNSFKSCWSPYQSDIKIKRLNDFLINLSEKSHLKNNYIEWELSKYFPNYINNVQNLISNLKCFEYNGSWPGANKNNEEYKIWFSDYKNEESIKLILTDFIKKNIDSFLENNKKKFFVEDNTWNILYAKELEVLVPSSKLIHVIRDPRDVVASFINQSWCPDNLKQCIEMYKSIIKKWFEICHILDKQKFKLIKLENLVFNKDTEIKKICSFCELNFESNLLEINLSMHNSGRWKNEFNNKEQNILNDSLKDIINKFNY